MAGIAFAEYQHTRWFYYSLTPQPDCRQEPREVEITQDPDLPQRLVSAVAVPASWR
ncbi:MAG TPA: hypothetical protein VJN43_16070 [Bryobacteraceae bacterium]|nr:hypothetical protein [Bryobacteraceae bacterium]